MNSITRLETGTTRLANAIGLVSLVFGIGMLAIGVMQPVTQPFILAAVLFITLVTAVACRDSSIIENPTHRIMLASGTFMIASLVYSALFDLVAVPVALLLIVISFIAASSGLEGSRSDSQVTMGLIFAILTALIGTNSPFHQVSYPFLLVIAIVLLAIVFLVFVWLNYRGYLVMALRLKIIVAALTIVVLPLAVLTTIDILSLRNSYQTQANEALKNSAGLLATRVDDFIMTNRASIATEALLPVFANYLQLDAAQRGGSVKEQQVKIALDSFDASLKVKERAFISSFALLDSYGSVIFSSQKNEVGNNEYANDYFTEPLKTGRVYHSAIEFSTVDNKPYIYFSTIIRNQKQNITGVLRVRYDGMVFQSLAKEYTGAVGSSSQPVIFDENYLRLADPLRPDLVFHGVMPLSVEQLKRMEETNRRPPISTDQLWTDLPGVVKGLNGRNQSPFFTTEIDQDGQNDSAAVVAVSSQPWLVVYLQDQSALTRAMASQYRLAILISTILAGVICFAATIAARFVNDPILDLTHTAQAITSGNLNVHTNIRSNDELGILGASFNLMAAQLQQMVTSLEDRVRDRTRELGHQNETLRLRARQFETVADVARGVAAAQELESLLDQVTRMISERFNFYHTGIFLLDEQGEYAVLRAANSEGGQNLLARQHKLKVGQIGIVGYATYQGVARIATDVGQDAVYFNNPDLPLTRSEMALPLKVGDRVIGALDVQSTESNAFSEDDTQLFAILADQIAIAIYNRRLFAETSQALAEAQVVHRRYLSQEWSQEVEEGQHYGYRYTSQGLVAQQNQEMSGIRTILQAGETMIDPAPGDLEQASGFSTLTVPVKLRGETIGVIHLQEETGECREWTQDEVETVQSVADQVALALENARLFTQTVRKADRERRVLEITSKIRSTNDPQAMLQIAVEELHRTLHASRAQVVLQPRIPEPENASGENGNGKNGNGYKHEPVG